MITITITYKTQRVHIPSTYNIHHTCTDRNLLHTWKQQALGKLPFAAPFTFCKTIGEKKTISILLVVPGLILQLQGTHYRLFHTVTLDLQKNTLFIIDYRLERLLYHLISIPRIKIVNLSSNCTIFLQNLNFGHFWHF